MQKINTQNDLKKQKHIIISYFLLKLLFHGTSFMNSPEFSKTVEYLTKGLMENFSNDKMTPKASHKKRTVNTENRTKDLILELPITLEEFYRGKLKKLQSKENVHINNLMVVIK